MRRLGATYRPRALGKIDRRQWEARLLRDFKASLTAHLGGSPSFAQSTLIDRAAQLQLRLSIMDRDFGEQGSISEGQSKVYLAWSNSLCRTLSLLGLKAAKAKGPSLAEYMASQGFVMAGAANGSGQAVQPRPRAHNGGKA